MTLCGWGGNADIVEDNGSLYPAYLITNVICGLMPMTANGSETTFADQYFVCTTSLAT